ncbi:hypothetical protein GQ53DRAFT_712331 [Thozetella sp. PMI_491]|nr:hypothetical protein GQ53DRAFT_712331 [Thozetella sp. PMI_491]
MDSLFQLPSELLLTALSSAFPARGRQVRALLTLLDPNVAPARNIVLHGTEATGKSAIAEALLRRLTEAHEHFDYTIISSVECITERHFFERTLARVADTLGWESKATRCDDTTQLALELAKMLKFAERPDSFRFVLVLDGIDRQREAQPTLLPALARLSEIIPCLTTVFIVTNPEPDFLETPFVPHIEFPNYSKAEFVAIASLEPPPALPNTSQKDTADLWARFADAVCDALTRTASRTLPTFRHAYQALWPRFTAPVSAGTHTAKDFPKLLIAARAHFQDESLLDPGIVAMNKSASAPPVPTGDGAKLPVNGTSSSSLTPSKPKTPAAAAVRPPPDLASLLPGTARLLLLAAYLASHNATKHDLTVFSTFHHGRKRKRGGLAVSTGGGQRGRPPKHRKIARKLLGAHAFVLERMLAIFAAVRREWLAEAGRGAGGRGTEDTDVGMAIATLASLRLLVRVGGATGGDPMDRGGKWRVNVGWEVVRGLGRSMGMEVEDWLVE